MLGSSRKEYANAPTLTPARFYSVRVLGRTLWGWESRAEDGRLVARADRLFPDYVSCVCDAGRAG